MNADVALIELHRLLDPERPPPSGLWLAPPESAVPRVIEALELDGATREKFILVGALGCGKSSELRAVAEAVRAEGRDVVLVDLDVSGVDVSSVSAFDLLYLTAAGVLRSAPEADQERCFKELARASAPAGAGDGVGGAAEVLGAFASAASTAGESVAAAAGAGGVGKAAGAMLTLAAASIRLMKQDGLVQSASPRGRALQAVADDIAATVRASGRPLPLLVVDGLEKMNGQSVERYHQVFQYTRLLADAPWPMVVSAPPVSMTEVSAEYGFEPLPLYGFGTDAAGQEQLLQALELRFAKAEVAVDVSTREALTAIVAASGGFPRHAVRMTRSAVRAARRAGRTGVVRADAEEAQRLLAEELARALNAESLAVLRFVADRGVLPGADAVAAALFAHGRLLALRPARGARRPRFIVHPLLADDVAAWTATSG